MENKITQKLRVIQGVRKNRAVTSKRIKYAKERFSLNGLALLE